LINNKNSPKIKRKKLINRKKASKENKSGPSLGSKRSKKIGQTVSASSDDGDEEISVQLNREGFQQQQPTNANIISGLLLNLNV